MLFTILHRISHSSEYNAGNKQLFFFFRLQHPKTAASKIITYLKWVVTTLTCIYQQCIYQQLTKAYPLNDHILLIIIIIITSIRKVFLSTPLRIFTCMIIQIHLPPLSSDKHCMLMTCYMGNKKLTWNKLDKKDAQIQCNLLYSDYKMCVCTYNQQCKMLSNIYILLLRSSDAPACNVRLFLVLWMPFLTSANTYRFLRESNLGQSPWS